MLSRPAGLNMHHGKTKVMFNSHIKPSVIIVDGKIIKEVDSSVYLGKKIAREDTLLLEVQKRIVLG